MAAGTDSDATFTDDVGARPPLISAGKQDAPDYERREDGIWCYRGTDVPVPGATDVTFGDLVAAREVRRPGRDPESVLLSLSELIAEERLNWVLQSGVRLEGADEDLFLVPWPVWRERASEPVDAYAPERDDRGVGHQLAVAERDLRLLRREIELATNRRARAVAIASELGLTRRQIGELLGISPARVQQLLDDAPAALRLDVGRFIEEARAVIGRLSTGGVARGGLSMPGWSDVDLGQTIDELIAWELVVEDPAGTLKIGKRAAVLIEDDSREAAGKAGRR